MRDRFLFYGSFWEALSDLTDEQKGQCLTALSNYALYGEEPSFDNPIVKLFFTMAKPQIDANNQRFENGNKGGAPKKIKKEPKNNQKITEQEPKNNQTETEMEGNKKEKEKENKKNNISSDKSSEILQKKTKLSFEEVLCWEDLISYWEENKRGGKYKNQESRQRMLDKLKQLTENDFDYAKQAICHCLDNGYQGFCNGNELFYKGIKPQWKTIESKPDAFEIFNQAMDEIERRAAQ